MWWRYHSFETLRNFEISKLAILLKKKWYCSLKISPTICMRNDCCKSCQKVFKTLLYCLAKLFLRWNHEKHLKPADNSQFCSRTNLKYLLSLILVNNLKLEKNSKCIVGKKCIILTASGVIRKTNLYLKYMHTYSNRVNSKKEIKLSHAIPQKFHMALNENNLYTALSENLSF